MSNVATNRDEKVTTIWERLRLLAEDIAESPAERLDNRVRRLEGEVRRLSALVQKAEKS